MPKATFYLLRTSGEALELCLQQLNDIFNELAVLNGSVREALLRNKAAQLALRGGKSKNGEQGYVAALQSGQACLSQATAMAPEEVETGLHPSTPPAARGCDHRSGPDLEEE